MTTSKFLQSKMTKRAIIIALAALLLVAGALTWNGLKSSNTNVAETDTKNTNTLPGNALYENERYSYQYKVSKWKPEADSSTGELRYSSVLNTLDFKKMGGEGIGSSVADGAQIAILTEPSKETLQDSKNSVTTTLKKFGAKAENVKDVTIDGIPAISYETEGTAGRAYHTIFVAGGYSYAVAYQVAKGNDPAEYIAGYKTLLSTFRFK